MQRWNRVSVKSDWNKTENEIEITPLCNMKYKKTGQQLMYILLSEFFTIISKKPLTLTLWYTLFYI